MCSKKLNQELSSWKVVLEHLGRVETTWRGIPLSRRDQATYAEAILLGGLVLNDLSNLHEGCGTHGDHVRWTMKMVHVDVSLLASFLSEAISLWRHLSKDDFHPGIRSYAGFKHQLSLEFPFAGDFLAPIKKCIEMHFANSSPNTFYVVYQHLSFLNHLTLLDIDMSQELEDGYVEREVQLTHLQLPGPLIIEMNRIMRSWLSELRVDEASFMPQHGPGSVAELSGDRSLYSKYRALASDPLIDYVFRKYMSVDVSTYAPLDLSGHRLDKTSRTVFVPKSMKTQRTISMEPAMLQYLQQGIDGCIRKYISQHWYLSRHIDLRDQRKQQAEAVYASSSQQLATVDLSAASDSVSWELVKRVFAGTTLLPYLWCLRSTKTVLPSGKVMELAKFAPMGSALCFPIQTLIFAALCECACRYVHATTGPSRYRYRVYGDDIIIPDPCLEDLALYLRWCGFSLNEAKTYGGNYRFRESCGCDAYDGVDVTPLKISRKFSARRISVRTPGDFSARVDLANSASVHQFLLLRRYVVDKLVNDTRFIPLFSEDEHHGVCTPSASNFRLPERTNGKYQRQEVRAAKVVAYTSFLCPSLKWHGERRGYGDNGLPPCDGDDIRYFERLRSASDSTADVLHPEHPASIRGGRHWVLVTADDFCNERPKTRVGSSKTYLSNRWYEKPSVQARRQVMQRISVSLVVPQKVSLASLEASRLWALRPTIRRTVR